MKPLLYLFVLLSSLLFAQAVSADDAEMKKAYDFYIDGDFDGALLIITRLAGKGDLEAQYVLGYMYEEGHVTAQNSAEAAKWFRLAADRGDAISQISLGRLYEKGRGVKQDYVQATGLYEKAATHGSHGDTTGRRSFIGSGEACLKIWCWRTCTSILRPRASRYCQRGKIETRLQSL